MKNKNVNNKRTFLDECYTEEERLALRIMTIRKLRNFKLKNMDYNAQQILSRITQHLIDNPTERFGQVLFNLGINQFANQTNPGAEKHLLRDIYNDTNEKILERLTK